MGSKNNRGMLSKLIFKICEGISCSSFSVKELDVIVHNDFFLIYPSFLVILYPTLSAHLMMTSSNGSIFRVTGPLCGEFTGLQWIPCTKASDAELWCFLWSAPWINGWVNNREVGDLRRHWAHYDVIVIWWLRWELGIVIRSYSDSMSISWHHHGSSIENATAAAILNGLTHWPLGNLNEILGP